MSASGNKSPQSLSRKLQRGFAGGQVMLAIALAGAAATSTWEGQSNVTAGTMEIQRQMLSDNALQQAAYLLASESADTDGDGFNEAPAMATGASVTDGGVIPLASSAPKTDGWGRTLGYCAWDHGSINSSVGRITGQSSATMSQPVFAVVSAGPDGIFDTSCSEAISGPQGDDRVTALTGAQIRQGVGGTIYYGDPVETAADLGALDTSSLKDGEIRLAKATGEIFRWDEVAAQWISLTGGESYWTSNTAGDLYRENGNIAIGTADTTQAKLTINGSAKLGDLLVRPNDINQPEGSSTLEMSNGGNLYVRGGNISTPGGDLILGDLYTGSVLVGKATDNGLDKLQIAGSTEIMGSGYRALGLYTRSSSNNSKVSALTFEANNSSNQKQIYSAISAQIENSSTVNGSLLFNTSQSGINLTRMRLTSYGNLLLGEVPYEGANRLHVADDKGSMMRLGREGNSQQTRLILTPPRSSSNSTKAAYVTFESFGVDNTTPFTAGYMGVFSNTWNTLGYAPDTTVIGALAAGGLSLISGDASAPIRFVVGGENAINERARITADGNLLVATAANNGVDRLQIAQGATTGGVKIFTDPAIDGRLSFNRGGADVAQYIGTFDGALINGFQVVRLATQGIERMRVSTTGNILVGTIGDDGTNKLQVAGSIRSTGNITSAGDRITLNSGNSGDVFIQLGRQGKLYGEIQAGYQGVGWNAPIVMQRQGGNILVGSTTDNGADRLQVNGSIMANGLKIGENSTTSERGADIGPSYVARINASADKGGVAIIGSNSGIIAGQSVLRIHHQGASVGGSVFRATSNAGAEFIVTPKGSVLIGTDVDDGVNRLLVDGRAKIAGNLEVTQTFIADSIRGSAVTADIHDLDADLRGSVRPFYTGYQPENWPQSALTNYYTGFLFKHNISESDYRTVFAAGSNSNKSMFFAKQRTATGWKDWQQFILTEPGSNRVLIGTNADNGLDMLQVNGSVSVGAHARLYSSPYEAILSTRTATGSDSSRLQLAGGGAPTHARGGYINIHGNQHPNYAGDVDLLAGNVPAGKIGLFTRGLERMRIAPSGNILIGTIVDDNESRLQVSGSRITVQRTENDTQDRWHYGFTRGSGGGGGAHIGTMGDGANGVGAITFGFHAASPMVLNKSGNLLLGAISDDGSNRLLVNGGLRVTAIDQKNTLWGGAIAGQTTPQDLKAGVVFRVGAAAASDMANTGRVAILGDTYGTAELYLNTRSSTYTAHGAGIRGVWAGADARNHHLTFFSSTFSEQNAERMRITDKGNVLIGSNVDNGSRFQVNGVGQFSGDKTPHWGAGVEIGYTGTAGFVTSWDRSAGVRRDLNLMGNVVSFFPNGVESGRFTAGGRFLLGAIADDGGNRLQVAGDMAVTDSDQAAQITLKNTSTGGNTWYIQSSGAGASYGAGHFSLYDVNGSSHRFQVRSSGNVLIGSTIDDELNRLQVSGGAIISADKDDALTIQRAAGTNVGLAFKRGSARRWLTYVDGSTEGAGNAGSDYVIARYNNDGTFVSRTLTIKRNTGKILIGTDADLGDSSKLYVAGEISSNGSKVWHAGNDGDGSGLDADTLDGMHAFDFFSSKVGSNDWNVKTNGRFSLISAQLNSHNGVTTTSGAYFPHSSGGYGMQIAGRQSAFMFRTEENSVWSPWHHVWHSGNDGAGSGLDADLLDGLSSESFLRSNAKNAADLSFSDESGNGRGIRFWNSDSFKIYMSATSDSTWGGRIFGETTSDYNLYFRMLSGTNRGFVFRTDSGNTFSINPTGVYSTVTINSSRIGNAPAIRLASGVGINAVAADDKSMVLTNLGQLRFGDGASFDWNSWAGIKYDNVAGVLYIGGPAGAQFSNNVNPKKIDVNFVGLNDNGLLVNGSKVWHAGNDGEGSGLVADQLDGLDSSSFFRRDTSNSADVRLSAGDGRGLRFWDNESYKIWMSSAANAAWGGRVGGETASDYNMYFRMIGGTNRGFTFLSGVTTAIPVFSINPDAVRSAVPLRVASFIQAGDTTAACNAANAGAIRYGSGGLQVCNGSNWGGVGGGGAIDTNSDILLHGMRVGRGDSNSNIVFGMQILTGSSDGTSNVVIGDNALQYGNYASSNMVIGSYALQKVKGGYSNVAIGLYAGQNMESGANNIILGHGALQASPMSMSNIAIGRSAFSNLTTGDYNVVIGNNAAESMTGGGSNVVIGNSAMLQSTSGERNVVIGSAAGMQLNGNYNVIIGGNNGKDLTNNTVLIADGQGNERFRINGSGNMSVGTSANPGYRLHVAGDINATGSVRANTVALTSDARLKENVKRIDNALGLVRRLNGVTWDWKDREMNETGAKMGLIAQEVERVLPGLNLVLTDSKGFKSVAYSNLTGVLVEAIKEVDEKAEAALKLAQEAKDLAEKVDRRTRAGDESNLLPQLASGRTVRWQGDGKTDQSGCAVVSLPAEYLRVAEKGSVHLTPTLGSGEVASLAASVIDQSGRFRVCTAKRRAGVGFFWEVVAPVKETVVAEAGRKKAA